MRNRFAEALWRQRRDADGARGTRQLPAAARAARADAPQLARSASEGLRRSLFDTGAVKTMATVLRLGRADHGRPMTLDEFWHSDYEEGYKYELIDGKLYVSPLPNLPGSLVERWI